MSKALDLGQLLEAHRERTGDSYGQLASRTSLSRATVYKLATQPLSAMPRPETIRQLAVSLRVAESVVRDAALRSVGLVIGEVTEASTHAEEVAWYLSKLSDEQVDAVLVIVRSMARPTPAPPASGGA